MKKGGVSMEFKKNFIIQTVFYAIALALAVVCYKYILPILTPFIIGFCVASIVRLPMRRLELKSPRQEKLMSALLCILFYVVIVGLIVLVAAWLVSEIQALVIALPGILETRLFPLILELGSQIQVLLEPIDPELTDLILDAGTNAIQSLGQYATNLSASAVKWVANSAVGIPNLLIQIILTVVSTFYFAADYQLVLNFIKKLIPDSKRQYIVHALRYAEAAVIAFIKSYSIMFCVVFVELCIGLSILRLPYAVAIAFGIALFDLLPVLGVGGILLPWSVIGLCMGNLKIAIGMLVLYLVIAAVRNMLEPRIVGERIGLHPLATLIAMILGLNIMGLLGMLLFPITLVAVVNFRKSAQQETQQTL